MSTGLTLFIGGPGHSAHDRMVATALSDPSLGSMFRYAQAFDDERTKPATVATPDWRSYLQGSDVAVFLLPHNRPGSKLPDGRFYTELEIAQACRSGIFIYLLIEGGGDNTSALVAATRRIFQNDFQFVPLSVQAPLDEIVAKLKDCLLDAVRRSEALGAQVLRDLAEIYRIAGTSAKVSDATLMSMKAKAPTSDATLIREYCAACWNLRRNHPREAALASYLLRGLLYILRPCMPITDILKTSGGPEGRLLDRIEGATAGGESNIWGSRTAGLSDEVFASVSDWRQREIVQFLREVAVFFRYRLDFARDWRYAKRAIELSRLLSASRDPGREDLFNLAVGVVASAAWALRTRELTRMDPENSLIGVLEERLRRDSNPGAAMTLGVYWASHGDLSRARGLLQTARGQLRAPAKLDGYVHALIAAACVETGNDRRGRFEALQNEVSIWQDLAHPPYLGLATEASRGETTEWRTLLQRIERKNGA